MASHHSSKPVPLHLYKPTVVEAQALAFMGEAYTKDLQLIKDAYAMVGDDDSKRRFYLAGHKLYHRAVTLAKKDPACPRSISDPWRQQPWAEPVKGKK